MESDKNKQIEDLQKICRYLPDLEVEIQNGCNIEKVKLGDLGKRTQGELSNAAGQIGNIRMQIEHMKSEDEERQERLRNLENRLSNVERVNRSRQKAGCASACMVM